MTMNQSQDQTYDVAVVGARCAGSATARLLAARGLRVVVLDRSAPTRDVLSTHGIVRPGVVQLHRWGLLDAVIDSGAPAVREITVGAPEWERTVPVRARAGVDLLVAPRRYVLDDLVARAAVEAGAELRTDVSVTGLLRDGERVAGVSGRTRAGESVSIRARHVVGADGLRSTVARLVGAPITASYSTDLAAQYAYVQGGAWQGYEFHAGHDSYSGVFPTHDGAGCVFVMRPAHVLDERPARGEDRGRAFLDLLAAAAPRLAARAAGGRVVGGVRSGSRLPNHRRRAHGPGWSLVGDAGYHRDPISGHGISDAFHHAELLADALAGWLHGGRRERAALADYEAERDAVSADLFRITRELAMLPDGPRFAELQSELGAAMDREADELAARPTPPGLAEPTAA
ncbi:NAD(P)/FAD-dependent oxidoreductase [Nocardioides sp. GY 10113]|uniref:NAD(P)/FAD-dependent oxidoreductase n=1 Tax=Nocardioides sp. GY 10113 TaxID=2569761 RepID=UPI0010A89B4E|nr:NAD(P)/FAD-dependent oxidoreductase [Nocardioides sp. GY 10113]TIC88108.1 NAD(P)/FAD-dependent oxidoreductase [Nocardioides sp. GY 10113]